MSIKPLNVEKYYVFLASPGDVNPERQEVRSFFDEYNKTTADSRDLSFIVVDWENYSTAGVGRPQELITRQTLMKHRDHLALFVGIMGQRFGSNSGKYESGTEEEFECAMQFHQQTGWPEIKWFFRKIEKFEAPSDPEKILDALEQWKKVRAFHERLDKEKEFYFKEFSDTLNFRDVLLHDVLLWLNHPKHPWNSSPSTAKKPKKKATSRSPARLRTAKTAVLPPAQREKLLTDYLHHVIKNTQDLPLRGIYSPRGEQLRVQLERVFVSLKATPTRAAEGEPVGHHRDPLKRIREAEEETSTLTMEAALKAHHHLVILGAPGSGKTTLPQYVALCYARDRATGSTLVRDRLQLGESGSVPLLFLLRDLGKYLKSYAPVDDGTEGFARVLEFFHRTLQENHLSLAQGFFEEDLKNGRAVVLFDGMDEVGDRELRRRVARMIEKFAQRYSSCRILVTSRIIGYEGEACLGGDFETTTIDKFTPDDVRLFLQQWHRHVAELEGASGERAQRVAEENTAQLLHEIETHDRLYELAINPLILTVIALLHREDLKLPERRVDLYAKVVELMLGRRDERRGVENSAIFDNLTFGLEERQEVFQAVALDMHVKALKEIDHGDLKDLLVADFQRRTTERSAIARAVERFLQGVLERTGLLVDAGNESYSFAHLSFQEYLVARQMADSETYLDDTLQRLADPFWREAILLEFGCLSKGRRNRLLQAMYNAQVAPESGNPLHNLVLAADCLYDVGLEKIDAVVLTELRRRLHGVVAEPLPAEAGTKVEEDGVQEDRRAFAVRRVTAAWALDKIAGEVKLPNEALALKSPYWSPPFGEPEWVTIPAGEFWMGSEKEDDESPVHRVFVSEFRIARTPVTNVQYWLYVHEKKVSPPSYWNGERPPRAQLNHPVVEVSWEDAQGYCAWLAGKIGKAVRLPTEAEWEKAARGDQDTRRYPWGDRFDVARCNNWEIEEARGTTPVGLFPEGRSPAGCLDMSGNVWEWVQDWYGGRYYRKSPKRDPKGPLRGEYRVLRGGSWINEARFLRVSNRNGRAPGGRYGGLGFRCAV